MSVKVLMVSDVYFPRINGVSTSIQTFRDGLGALGVASTLVAPAYPVANAGAGAPDRDIVRIPSLRVPLDPEDRCMRRGAIDALLPRLAGEGYGAVHIQTPFVAHYAGVALAQRLGVPALASYHTFFEEYLFHYFPFAPRNWMRALARRFSRAQCNDLDAIVVPSTPMRDALLRYGVTARMEILPTGLPDSAFLRVDGTRFRARHGIAAQRRVALFVGRVAHEKNIAFLLHAIDRVRLREPAVLLVIAGEGPALPALRRLAARLGLGGHVLFVGYLERARELPDCYCAADAFVFASRTETQGLVILEAMALSVPVVSTAVMGTLDVVGPRRGALVPADDEAQFAAALETLLGDAELHARLSREARAYAGEWRAAAMAGRLAAMYRSLGAGRAPVSMPQPLRHAG